MKFLEFLSLYGITERDLRQFPSLASCFPAEFKEKLGKLVKEFTLKNLPDSAAIILGDVSPNAFAGTIERFISLMINHPERIGVYLNAVSQTHLDMDVKISDFMSSYAEFYREVLFQIDIQKGNEETLKKFLLFVYLAGIYMFIQQVEKIQKYQEKDPITGLPSKRPFVLRLKGLLSKYKSLILLDIDKFNEINMYHSYNVGNAVLAVVASELQNHFPDSYLVRFQNDEFIIMDKNIPALAKEKLHSLAKTLREQSHVLPLKKGETLNINFSAIIIETELCKELDFESIMWVAYESLRKVKSLHLSAKEIISQEKFRRLLNRKNMLGKVAEAIYGRSIAVANQMIVDAFSGKPVFHEILARLVLPEKPDRIVPAGCFIDLIADSYLEAELDEAVVERILNGGYFGKISLNLSNVFLQRKFSWFVKKLKKTDYPLENIMIELSERKGIAEETEVRNRLKALKKMGISILIDDFGIKYSNYYIMKTIEVDGIKIDGSVVRDICHYETDRIFVEGIIRLAKEKGIFVVAEYVENEEIANLLRKIATKSDFHRLYFQGYYIEKPKLLTELKAS